MEEGGLGFRRILDFNAALLSKWMWKYAQGGNHLWRKIIKEKFGEQPGGWFSQCTKSPIKYSLWKGILKVKELFTYCSSFKVGRGDTIQFWHNNWLGGTKLSKRFPALFTRSRRKSGFISDFRVDGEWCFDMNRRLSDREIAEVAELLSLLEGVNLTPEEDKLQWWSEGKPFSVRNCYLLISQARVLVQGLGVCNFSSKKIWRGVTPARVNFFIWLLVRHRVLTDDRLKEMGTNLASRCSFCGKHEETKEHLFLGCCVTQEALHSIMWGSGTDCSSFTVNDFVVSWESHKLTKEGVEYWQLLPHAFFWGVWMARNSCRFEEGRTQGWRLLQSIKYLLWQWGLDNKVLEKVRIEQLMFSWRETMYK
ncbi:mannosylglycoprotein endo-beta-mannosidase [Ranunculus cassubicifolius]